MPALSSTVWVILAGAFLTYLTRILGDLVLSRFEKIPPRIEAALDAIPAAVLSTLVAPALFFEGPAESLTLIIVAIAAFRLSLMQLIILGWITILLARRLL